MLTIRPEQLRTLEDGEAKTFVVAQSQRLQTLTAGTKSRRSGAEWIALVESWIDLAESCRVIFREDQAELLRLVTEHELTPEALRDRREAMRCLDDPRRSAATRLERLGSLLRRA